MGIFGDSGGQRGRHAAKGYNLAANECLQVLCDRCHAAWAKVEVITRAGSVFFCQHHHKKYRHSVIAAGHQIRAVLLTGISAHRTGQLGVGVRIRSLDSPLTGAFPVASNSASRSSSGADSPR